MKRLLDEADRRILAELERNARIPHAALATLLNLSRNAVRQRVERLERDGFIRGYTIIGGEKPSEPSRITALIFVYRHDRMRGGDVIRALKRIPEVVSCDVLSGEFDLLLRVEARDSDRIRQIWVETAALPGVRDTLTAFVLSSGDQQSAARSPSGKP